MQYIYIYVYVCMCVCGYSYGKIPLKSHEISGVPGLPRLTLGGPGSRCCTLRSKRATSLALGWTVHWGISTGKTVG